MPYESAALLRLRSSGVELVNAAALLLLFVLNLLLVGRQERLKRSEMVRRLKGIITQLSGESELWHANLQKSAFFSASFKSVL